MKKILLTACCTLFITTTVLMAQAVKVKQVDNGLNLTKEQKLKLKAIDNETKLEIKAIDGKVQTTPQSNKGALIKQIKINKDAKIKAILSPEQYAKFKSQNKANTIKQNKTKKPLTKDEKLKLAAHMQELKLNIDAVKADASLTTEARKAKILTLRKAHEQYMKLNFPKNNTSNLKTKAPPKKPIESQKKLISN